ncbi:hypothetical protein D3C86_1470920 [compost metagenome]
MLACKNDHRTVEYENVIHRAFLRTFSLVMNDPCFREVYILITALNDAVGEVNVFSVHKKCFVEQTYFIQRFLAHQHKCTGKNLNFVRFEFGQIAQMVFPEDL